MLENGRPLVVAELSFRQQKQDRTPPLAPCNWWRTGHCGPIPSPLPIQHAVFYSRDEYPDETVISDGERLRRLWQPDFLLIHTMNVDDAGHRFGAESLEYRIAAVEADRLLSLVVPQWLAEGYQVVVASDHGMRGVKHGGNSPEERETLLFTAGNAFSHTPGVRVRQTEICGTVCELLGLVHDKPCCKELLG